uniref:Preprotein translocase subunit SecE n=1 Tax=Ignisphaera aggregans TaxID=334771 RepID=A0A7J3I9J6_9CREN
MRKIIDLAEKPDADDFKQILKITLLGFTLVGVAAFALSWLINFILQISGAGIT